MWLVVKIYSVTRKGEVIGEGTASPDRMKYMVIIMAYPLRVCTDWFVMLSSAASSFRKTRSTVRSALYGLSVIVLSKQACTDYPG